MSELSQKRARFCLDIAQGYGDLARDCAENGDIYKAVFYLGAANYARKEHKRLMRWLKWSRRWIDVKLFFKYGIFS